ncbi:putative 2-haloalkanoic acid dehalogenase [Aspergillus arachidicola]|uniref:Putative 2-haloalkanoic acid dehalogenase n=1 Tax=Aspergillus arachidicola TaxID=656916 RepID=A0A2G7FZI1_9EURO|nr:putative 2-haloalkanoic acid dehalogenase [Aspergillus arachidicola]
MTPKKHVVFDVVGTCVSFDAFYNCIDRVIGDKLRAQCITPRFFGFSWMTAAELEFTFLSISERYKPYKEVITALFYRTLHMAGIEDPRSFATEAERDQCVQGYSGLELRPGTRECFAKLREAGFTVWCLTTGDTRRVRGYFERAGVDMPPAMERFAEEDVKWFAAAHMWDVSAAVKVGFRGAYCTVYEKESCAEIFDTQMEVLADSLPEMADKIIAASG